MPRKKFSLAPDAAARRIECQHYDLNNGAPRCNVCNHPWCLAPGESQFTCAFHDPPEQPQPAPRKASKGKGSGDGKK